MATARAATKAATNADEARAAKRAANNNRKVLAKNAVSLQQIIAARWYLCEVTGEAGQIAADHEAKQHQEVVFAS